MSPGTGCPGQTLIQVPDPSHVSYQPDQGTVWTFALRDVPGPLRAKLAVLRLFACYMQRRLREVRARGVGRARRGRLGPKRP